MDCSEGATTNLHQGITSASFVATLVNEEKEKEKGQFYLILHNIKESDDTDSSKWKEEDACAAISIFKDYLDVTASITKCFRIGKKHEYSNKPHLLKITVGSLDEKENPEHIRKLFITLDLTPTE